MVDFGGDTDIDQSALPHPYEERQHSSHKRALHAPAPCVGRLPLSAWLPDGIEGMVVRQRLTCLLEDASEPEQPPDEVTPAALRDDARMVTLQWAVTSMRALLNWWYTSRRTHDAVRDKCLFGCMVEADGLEHCVGCVPIRIHSDDSDFTCKPQAYDCGVSLRQGDFDTGHTLLTRTLHRLIDGAFDLPRSETGEGVRPRATLGHHARHHIVLREGPRRQEPWRSAVQTSSRACLPRLARGLPGLVLGMPSDVGACQRLIRHRVYSGVIVLCKRLSMPTPHGSQPPAPHL